MVADLTRKVDFLTQRISSLEAEPRKREDAGTGKVRARLASLDGLELLNANGGIISQVKSGSAGAGQFWLYDASGTPMIKAGTTEGGVGLLQAGPGNKCVPSAGLGVPDCIRGRQLK